MLYLYQPHQHILTNKFSQDKLRTVVGCVRQQGTFNNGTISVSIQDIIAERALSNHLQKATAAFKNGQARMVVWLCETVGWVQQPNSGSILGLYSGHHCRMRVSNHL